MSSKSFDSCSDTWENMVTSAGARHIHHGWCEHVELQLLTCSLTLWPSEGCWMGGWVGSRSLIHSESLGQTWLPPVSAEGLMWKPTSSFDICIHTRSIITEIQWIRGSRHCRDHEEERAPIKDWCFLCSLLFDLHVGTSFQLKCSQDESRCNICDVSDKDELLPLVVFHYGLWRIKGNTDASCEPVNIHRNTRRRSCVITGQTSQCLSLWTEENSDVLLHLS